MYPPPAGPVWLDWLDRGETWPRVLLAIAAQVVMLAGGGYLMNDPFGLPTLPAALIALVLLVPFLFCCFTLPISLWLLPRLTAGVGVLVSADGLVLVRKRRWRPRAVPVPGVGADVTATRHAGPDAIGTGTLVRYPAIRLRLAYRHDLEPRARDSWTSARGDGATPFRLPAHQLRPALLAFRPDLCHGFDDVWTGSVRVGR